MAKYANQKTFKIHTTKVTKDFFQFSKEDYQLACRNLTASQLIVWTIFAGNADGYLYELSTAYVKETYGLSRQTVYAAIEAMEKAGYIIEENGQVHFYRQPQNTKKINISEPKKTKEVVSMIKNTVEEKIEVFEPKKAKLRDILTAEGLKKYGTLRTADYTLDQIHPDMLNELNEMGFLKEEYRGVK